MKLLLPVSKHRTTSKSIALFKMSGCYRFVDLFAAPAGCSTCLQHKSQCLPKTDVIHYLCGMCVQQSSGTLITHDADSQLIHTFIILFVLRWHAAWQERCQALERLRACITRKRISFRLFKSWYWQTFDDDMQVRSD